PIYQEIPNLSQAKSAYGNIVYRKAPSFLRQAEFYLGEDKFQTAVRAFLKKHEFANAEWTDLVKEFELASKQDLKDWANVWVTKRGMPKFFLPVNAAPNLISQSNVRIFQRSVLQDNTLWREKTKVLIILNDGSTKIVETNHIDKFTGTQVALNTEYKFVFPNYGDYGYGIFLLDEKSRAYVLENIQTEKDDFLRAMMWGSLWDSVREAELAPRDYVRLVIKNLNVETDESTIQTLLGRVSTAMNYYPSDKQRDEFAAEVETILIDKMQNAPTLGQRITFYRAFLNVASGKQTLKDVLSGKLQIKDLKLKTKDKFDIATKLLILSDKDATQILAELEKTETSDDAKRYAYAARAGIATAENKQKFFGDFTNNKEISESYIETAFSPFNSTKHADLTLPFLENALKELPNLKRNRKIFFVNGWLGAFVGGQKSEQALAIVNKFLADNPNLDKDLRLKVLENVDNLERAVKIRKKFSGLN
nr:M1 family metallopeptidase [Acidobacteriota bacterium]